MTGRVSDQPTIVLAYPVRDAAGAVVGVLGLGLNLTRLQTLFSDIPLPEGSVVTLTDAEGRCWRAAATPSCTSASRPIRTPSRRATCRATQVRTGLDGIERFYGNAVVDRGPWLLSVGIPTSVVASARRAALSPQPRDRRASAIAAILLFVAGAVDVDDARHRTACAPPCSGSPTAICRRRQRSRAPNRELGAAAGRVHHDGRQPARGARALDHQVEQERKMRETLQSLQRQVVRQERLAAVGVLVSGVAHELNNPLQAILGTLELLERDRGISPAVLDEIAFVKTQSGRAREIIRNLSRFSSQQSGPPTLVDLRDVDRRGRAAAPPRSRQRRRSRSTSTCRPTRKVYANFTEVEQVTLNFVINAQQSIEVGRPHARPHPDPRRSTPASGSGSKCRTMGPGVTPEDEPKLFQPFFTTKPVGKGTGLGLSVSYGIIESYGGTIGHRANEWGGATFFFELPVTEPARVRHRRRRARDHRSPMTDRLYYTDPYLRAFDATVARVERRDDRLVVTLDRTAFYPTSGGQPFDTGTLGALRVVDVVDEEDGSIAHVVELENRERREPADAGDVGARRDRLGAPVRSHAAAHRPARAVGGVRRAVRRPHRQLPSRRRRCRRSISRAR